MDPRDANAEAGWRFYREVLHEAKYFLAPMADCSILPFRILCKRHGTHIGVTPMIHAFVQFAQEKKLSTFF